MLLFALLSAQQLPPIALPSAAQSQTLERSEVDHVLVVTLAYLQMDGQPLIPLDQGSVPLAGRPGLEAALEVPRRADGACPERATLLVVADRRVPSFTMQVLETELKGSCFSAAWMLVETAPVSALPKPSEPVSLRGTLTVAALGELGGSASRSAGPGLDEVPKPGPGSH